MRELTAITFSAMLSIWRNSKALVIVNNTDDTIARLDGTWVDSLSKNDPDTPRPRQVQFTQFTTVHVLQARSGKHLDQFSSMPHQSGTTPSTVLNLNTWNPYKNGRYT